MLDLDHMPNSELDVSQPAVGLAASVEEIGGDANATDTDELGFEIEGEGDREMPNEDVELRRRKAAFAKQKQKAKEAKAREDAAIAESQRLKQELEDLKSQVGQLKVGPEPTYESCGYDDELFKQRMKEYLLTANGKPQAQASQAQAQRQAEYEPDLDVEFEHDESVAAIKKAGVSDYDDKSAALDSAIAELGMNPSVVRGQLRQLCSLADIDSGKAEYMIGRNPSVVAELASAKSQPQLKRILKREAEKLKLRQKQKIDTKPEVSIQSSGPLGSLDKQLQKARLAWQNAEPHNQAAAWQEYQLVKKQSKSK